MRRLERGLTIEISSQLATGSGAKTGHSWTTKRDGKIVGMGFAFGDIVEAFDDSIDDLRMLGLVVDE